MAAKVNIVENIECLETEIDGIFDQPRPAAGIIQEQLKNQLRNQLKMMLEKILHLEADEQIGAIRYERGILSRKDVRNGYRRRYLSTSMGTVELTVPRARKMRLSFSVFEAYKRRWKELDELLLEAYIGGMSCRMVGKRVASILGSTWSGSTIATLVRKMERCLLDFRNHPLRDEYEALIIDGMYVRIRQCGQQKRPVVVVLGLKANGSIDLLGIRVCYSENSAEVEGLLRSIKDRGLRGHNLKIITTDGDKGLEAAALSVFGHVRIQDCIFHRINRLHQNAEDKKCGRKMMKDASKAFAQADVRKQRKAISSFCNRWRSIEQKAIERFEHHIDRCFEYHQLPQSIRSKASTTNLCEGLFKQLRMRTNKIGAFESPLALERFIFAFIYQKSWINIPGRVSSAPLINTISTHLY